MKYNILKSERRASQLGSCEWAVSWIQLQTCSSQFHMCNQKCLPIVSICGSFLSQNGCLPTIFSQKSCIDLGQIWNLVGPPMLQIMGHINIWKWVIISPLVKINYYYFCFISSDDYNIMFYHFFYLMVKVIKTSAIKPKIDNEMSILCLQRNIIIFQTRLNDKIIKD